VKGAAVLRAGIGVIVYSQWALACLPGHDAERGQTSATTAQQEPRFQEPQAPESAGGSAYIVAERRRSAGALAAA
jgi:hypothetical protein